MARVQARASLPHLDATAAERRAGGGGAEHFDAQVRPLRGASVPYHRADGDGGGRLFAARGSFESLAAAWAGPFSAICSAAFCFMMTCWAEHSRWLRLLLPCRR